MAGPYPPCSGQRRVHTVCVVHRTMPAGGNPDDPILQAFVCREPVPLLVEQADEPPGDIAEPNQGKISTHQWSGRLFICHLPSAICHLPFAIGHAPALSAKPPKCIVTA